MKANKTIEVMNSSETAINQTVGILKIVAMSFILKRASSPPTIRRGGSLTKIAIRIPVSTLMPPMMNMP